jgi:hypothetical protein
MSIDIYGFHATDYEDRRAALVTRFGALAGANVATDEGTIEGDLITLVALSAQELEEQLVLTNAAALLRTASGAFLDRVAEPVVGKRRRAVGSIVEDLPLIGVAATVIPAGSAILPLGSDVLWVSLEEVTLDGGGGGEVDFQASTVGALAAVDNTTWTISTAVAGWTSAGPSLADAILGQLEESDEDYRRRALEAQRSGQPARDVWRVDGVTLVSIIENQTDILDAYWNATHWIELLVVGGTDAAVGAAIHGARAPGVNMLGNTDVVVPVDDYIGGEVTVSFSRPEEVEVYVSIAITKGEGYPQSVSAEAITARKTAIANALLSWAAVVLVPGADVYADAVKSAVFTTIPGVKAMTVLIGIVDPPLSTEVVIAVREAAVMAVGRIAVTGA